MHWLEAKQNKAKQSRTKQSRTKQNKAKQSIIGCPIAALTPSVRKKDEIMQTHESPRVKSEKHMDLKLLLRLPMLLCGSPKHHLAFLILFPRGRVLNNDKYQ